MDKPKYAENDPLSFVIEYLEKSNYDDLANQVIDVFAQGAATIEQNNLIAKLYLDIRNADKAEEYALKVLSMVNDPDSVYNCRANLAKLYNHLNEPEKSLYYSYQNQKVTPDDADTKLEIVFSLYLANRKKEAEDILRDMKANEYLLDDRHRAIVDFNLGTYNMEQGKFLEGFAGFVLNLKRLELWFSSRELPFKFWNGGNYPGRTLIMFMEGGGIGDEFITVRFMEDLKKAGFNPVYYTGRKDIAEMFNRCGFKAVSSLDGLPTDSLWTYAMQTPLWLKLKPEEIIRQNYLFPSEESRKKWGFIKENKKLKIGVRWQGNSKNERDLHRKVPLSVIMDQLTETLKGIEVDYYSLQIGDGVEALDEYPDIINVSDKIETYDDTLALLENLDYVVTSCTSVIHAAAIVGTKTLGLIPISAYFTWLSPPTEGRDDNTSIWYGDNLRIFKQVESKNWDKPLKDLGNYLIQDINRERKAND